MTEYSFGKTLAKLRKERKLTQQELADLLNVTNKTISKWETNTTAPDIDTLKRIRTSSNHEGIGIMKNTTAASR